MKERDTNTKSDLSSLSDAISKAGDLRRTKQKMAREAIQKAETEVPITDLSLEILAKIDHLRYLNSLADTFGAENQEIANDIEAAVKDLRSWLNGLQVTVPCKLVDVKGMLKD